MAAVIAALAGPAALAASPATPACPPTQSSRSELQALAGAGWKLADDAALERLAWGLLGCLASPDAELRDELGFGALSHWLRAGRLARDTMLRMTRHALGVVASPDGQGVDAPFAVLLLAELARVDRQQALWTPQQRGEVLDAAERYVSLNRDYRGFDPVQGWRHAVAHGADLLMQLAMNPALDRRALDRVLTAVAAQVGPSSHAYVFGEGERLMRPVFFVARRGLHDAEDWRRWLRELGQAAALQPGEATSLASLARRHNTKAFVLALYLVVQEEGDEPMRERLRPGILDALRAMR